MSDGEFIVPSDNKENKTMLIVGLIIAILIIGTYCCYQQKWLFFKSTEKKVEPKIESFQKIPINYDSNVEKIVEDLMKSRFVHV